MGNFAFTLPTKNPKVRYRIHLEPASGSSSEPYESRLHPHTLFKIHFNIIMPSTPRNSKLPLSSGFPIKFLYAFVISPMRVTFTEYPNLLHLTTLMIFSER